MRLRSALPLAALLLPAGLLTGCGDDGEAAPTTPATTVSTSPSASSSTTADAEYPTYVALGDSYTSAPLVPETDPQDGCLRSSGNYPSLVAAELEGTVLTDVSCAGADSLSLVGVQRTFDGGAQPPQLQAVTEDTSLVTISIGGNDFGLFSSLVGGCAQVAQQDPAGSPCADLAADQAPEALTKIRERVASAVEGIRGRAPDARILVVGYPQIVPQGDRSCPGLPIAEGDLPFARTVNQGLAEALAGAARKAGVEYVDVYAATEGHDICSDDPWIAGRETVDGQALAFHPFAAEQRAVADAVLEVLAR
jgi:lysophospholipase L1-like esterase